MPTKVVLPKLGESVFDATISKWLKSEGDEVSEFDPILEVNTDKVDTEIPSPGSGIILKILVNEGETIEVGRTLAWIGEQGEPVPENGPTREPSLPPAQAEPRRDGTDQTRPLTPGQNPDLGFISPIVARLAQENSLDLYQVQGTGQGGRITKHDVLAHLKERGEKRPPAAPPRPQPPPEPAWSPARDLERLSGQIIPHSAIRRSIAAHMVESKRVSPHVTTVMEADLSRVLAHREANKESFARDGIKLTLTAYFVHAAAAALKDHPMVNSSWTDEGILLNPQIHIGMATSLGDAGLIVPVVKDADRLSLLGLAGAINDLARRARSKQLTPDEVQGGTFTITNHGVSGSLFATPIISQPQCAIMGVGKLQKRVVVIEDENGNDAIAIRPMIYLTLTFDHRILDGAIADDFLSKVVKYLQNWK